MPELPEVESVRRSLLPHVIGHAVLRAELHRRDILIAPGDPRGGFPRQRSDAKPRPKRFTAADLLQGSTITDIRRCGKQLAIIARSPARSPGRAPAHRALVVQLGMTGHLEVVTTPVSPTTPSPIPHIHARWTLAPRAAGRSSASTPRATLLFHDARRFGTIRVFRSLAALDEHWDSLGPDALTIASPALARALHNSDRPIKAALLDQSVLAGVGNIYADESLFESSINPRIRARRLTSDQVARLAAAIRSVLARAIDAGGSTLSDYSDANGRPGSYQSSHGVYGRAGLPCPRCSRPLSSGLLAQRTTVWCPGCQPLRSRAPLRVSPLR